MSYRLSKIYTRKGDDGTTSLDAKNRIPKDSIRVEALGTIDELNSLIGMILAFDVETADVKNALTQVQQDLFNLGGELCPPHHQVMTEEKVSQLEQWLDAWNENLPPLKEFILPGGNPKSATCHLARTVCRRAERVLVSLNNNEKINPEMLKYVNRLSDLLFVAARVLGKETESKEVLWDHERKKK